MKAVVLAFLMSAAVLAQGQVSGAPAFEVVSIKRNTENPRSGAGDCRLGRFRMVNGRIGDVIAFAYPHEVPELIGAPSWVLTDPYDIEARAAGSEDCEQMRPMMRTLLADRLKLSAHYESKEADVFALVVARSGGRLGPQIRRSELDCMAIEEARRSGQTVPRGCGMQAGAGRLEFHGQPVSRLTTQITQAAGRFVIDKTELQGNYDYSLEYAMARALAQGNPNNLPNIFTALQEQLGLKLQPERAMLRSLVIDHIERPTDN